MNFKETLQRKARVASIVAVSGLTLATGGEKIVSAHNDNENQQTIELITPTPSMSGEGCDLPEQPTEEHAQLFSLNDQLIGGPQEFWTQATDDNDQPKEGIWKFDGTDHLSEQPQGWTMQVPHGMIAEATVLVENEEQTYLVMGGENAEICDEFGVIKMNLFTSPEDKTIAYRFDEEYQNFWVRINETGEKVSPWYPVGMEPPLLQETVDASGTVPTTTIQEQPSPSDADTTSDTTSDGTQGASVDSTTPDGNNGSTNQPTAPQTGGSNENAACDFSAIGLPLTNTEDPNKKEYHGDPANAQEFYVPDNINVVFYNGQEMITGYGPGEAKSSTATFYCDFTEKGMDLPDEWVDPGEGANPGQGGSEPVACRFDEIGVPLTDTDDPNVKVYNGDPNNAQEFTVPDGINAQFFDGTQMVTGHDGEGKSSNATFYCDSTEAGVDLPDEWVDPGEGENPTPPPTGEPTQPTPEAPIACRFDEIGVPLTDTEDPNVKVYNGDPANAQVFNVPDNINAVFYDGTRERTGHDGQGKSSNATFYCDTNEAGEDLPDVWVDPTQEVQPTQVVEPTPTPTQEATIEPELTGEQPSVEPTQAPLPTETPEIEEEMSTEPTISPTAMPITTEVSEQEPVPTSIPQQSAPPAATPVI